MAVSGTTVTLGATGATAVVAPAVTGYAGQTIYRGERWRTAVINTTGATVYLGGSPTGTTSTMGLATSFPISVPLGPDEGIYGITNAGASTVFVLVTGG